MGVCTEMGGVKDGTQGKGSEVQKMLAGARAERKETDEQLQAMVNRISFLKQEEAKLDRDIATMRKRAEDLLGQKAERTKDDDVLQATKDVLAALNPNTKSPASIKSKRPGTGTGRSSIAQPKPYSDQAAVRGSSGETASTTAPATASMGTPPLPRGRAGSAQRTARPPAVASPLAATAPRLGRSTSEKQKPAAAASSSPAAARTSSARSSSSNPRAVAASTSSPLTTSPTRATARATSSGAPTKAANLPRQPSPPPTQDRTTASSGCSQSGAQPAGTQPSTQAALTGANAASVTAGMEGEAFSRDSAAGASVRDAVASVANKMAMLGAERRGVDAEAEVVEELIAASSAAPAVFQMEGLHQFVTQEVPKVVHVKSLSSTTAKASAQAVVAAGVGWGVRAGAGSGPLAPPVPTPVPVAEMAKKQQIWKVRKAFGLPATQLQDNSAHVDECGAGAWK